MSKEIAICSNCGAEIPPGETHCPICGTWPTPEVAEETFEALHLEDVPVSRQRLRVLSEDESRVIEDVPSEYMPLDLAGKRAAAYATSGATSSARVVLLLGVVISAVVWAVAQWRIVTLDDWGIWEPIWYVAALFTVVLGAMLLIVAWRTARRQRSWGEALRSFLP